MPFDILSAVQNAVAAATPVQTTFSGPIVSLRSEAFPDRYIRAWNKLGWVDVANSDDDKKEATFGLAPGLSDPKAISLRLVWKLPWYPTEEMFLRHWAFRVKLEPQAAAQFNGDFTFFMIEPSLTGTPGFVSFRAFNFPDKYLHARDDKSLWIDASDGSNGFNANASFKAVGPLAAPPGYVPKELPLAQQIGTVVAQAVQSMPPPGPVSLPSTPTLDAAVNLPKMLGPDPVQATRDAMGRAVVQAAGLGPANTYLSSVMGAGLGGADKGTGPLPGAFGVAARDLFGVPFVPHPSMRPGVRLTLEASGPFASAIERLGRALLTPLLGLSPGFLHHIRIGMDDAQNFAGDEDRFRAHILTLLRDLTQRMQRAAAAVVPGAPALSPARLALQPNLFGSISGAPRAATPIFSAFPPIVTPSSVPNFVTSPGPSQVPRTVFARPATAAFVAGPARATGALDGAIARLFRQY